MKNPISYITTINALKRIMEEKQSNRRRLYYEGPQTQDRTHEQVCENLLQLVEHIGEETWQEMTGKEIFHAINCDFAKKIAIQKLAYAVKECERLGINTDQ